MLTLYYYDVLVWLVDEDGHDDGEHSFIVEVEKNVDGLKVSNVIANDNIIFICHSFKKGDKIPDNFFKRCKIYAEEPVNDDVPIYESFEIFEEMMIDVHYIDDELFRINK